MFVHDMTIPGLVPRDIINIVVLFVYVFGGPSQHSITRENLKREM